MNGFETLNILDLASWIASMMSNKAIYDQVPFFFQVFVRFYVSLRWLMIRTHLT